MNLMDLFVKIAVKDEASDKVSKIASGIACGKCKNKLSKGD